MGRPPKGLGRRGLRAAAAVGVATALLGAASPAWGHEFGLALVVDTTGATGPAGVDARDGFRLAVDESPDVSHTPGEEAGDHLGGVDVEIVAVEPAGTPAATVERVRAALEGGASVVVMLAAPDPTVAAVSAGLGAGEVVLLNAGGGPPSTGSPPPAGVLAVRDREPGGVNGNGAERFDRSFLARYGRPPSVWAQRGYDAARVLDLAVARLGPHARDTAAVAGVANASGALLRSRVIASPPAPGPSATPARGLGRPAVILTAGSVLLGALLVALARRRRRRRRRGG